MHARSGPVLFAHKCTKKHAFGGLLDPEMAVKPQYECLHNLKMQAQNFWREQFFGGKAPLHLKIDDTPV